MPLSLHAHAGGCCGMSTVYAFNHLSDAEMWTPEDRTQRIRDVIETHQRLNEAKRTNHLYEVVLTDMQMQQADWATTLRDYGFHFVTRFRNSNTGNICNVFHYNSGGRESRRNEDLPFNWPRRARRAG